jgi:hypothetical protein
MRKEIAKRSSDTGNPRELRDRAASIRWATEGMQNESRVRELQDFADELDAEANRLEAANHRRSRRTD